MIYFHLRAVTRIRNQAYIKAFGQHVRKLRVSKGLTQQDLAMEADIEMMQVYRIETGKTNATISTILALATALEISPKKLLDFDY